MQGTICSQFVRTSAAVDESTIAAQHLLLLAAYLIDERRVEDGEELCER